PATGAAPRAPETWARGGRAPRGGVGPFTGPWRVGPASSQPAAAQPTPPVQLPKNVQKIGFAQQIKPILERSCVACHRGEKPRGGFRVVSRDAIRQGGASGTPAVVPEHSRTSALIT